MRRTLVIARSWQTEFKIVPALVLVMFLLGRCAVQAQQKPEQIAAQAADAWLALVDSGRYSESWQDASPSFKARTSREQWEKAMGEIREPLGKLRSRTRTLADYSKAPDGEHVLIQYDSRFERQPSAVETITSLRDQNGTWRVTGYFIK